MGVLVTSSGCPGLQRNTEPGGYFPCFSRVEMHFQLPIAQNCLAVFQLIDLLIC